MTNTPCLNWCIDTTNKILDAIMRNRENLVRASTNKDIAELIMHNVTAFRFVNVMLRNNPKIFKVNTDLSKLFLLTDNDLPRHTEIPFKSMYIEAMIPIMTDSYETIQKYYGILLYNDRKIDNDYVIKKTNIQSEYVEGGTITAQCMGVPEGGTFSDTFITTFVFDSDENTQPTVKLMDNPVDEIKQLKSYVANLLDYINNPEVVIVNKKRSTKKYLGKRQPKTVDVVRLTGKLQRYIYELKRGKRFHFNHSFWVRGHWRRFESEFYKEKRGTSMWIKPHIRGSGVLMNNKYIVT